MKHLPSILFAATFAALPLTTATAQGHGDAKPAPAPQEAEKGKKNDGFAVIQVGEEMKVVAQAEIDNTKKQIQDEHQKALDAWKAAKKAADDKKEKFDKPEPKPTAFHVVKGGFKSQEEANTFLTAEKEKAKGKGKEKDKPKEGGDKGKGHGDKGKGHSGH